MRRGKSSHEIPAMHPFTVHADQPFGLRICIRDVPTVIERDKRVGDALQKARPFSVRILGASASFSASRRSPPTSS